MNVSRRTAASAALAASLAWATIPGAHAQTTGTPYAGQQASAASIESATREIGILQTRLRAEHLATHVTQTALLDVHQIERYSVFRGYADAKASETAPGHAVPAPAPGQHH